MQTISIPFKKMDIQKILNNTKTSFISKKLFGYDGAFFTIEGNLFQINKIRRVTIFQATKFHFKSCGFESQEEFMAAIENKYFNVNIENLIYLYTIQKINENGKKRI